ncbi:unnamed protein product [Acanthosepion pharaonis]|uniref:Uncharacterized protein n=1 Tax=Acanthosepion pharaonis TaxID=158019 RepID=A0A812DN88_ACAPH|nr:unnamed protein product [Sepia pharaonis]
MLSSASSSTSYTFLFLSVHLILFPFHQTSPRPFSFFSPRLIFFPLLFLCFIVFSFPPPHPLSSASHFTSYIFSFLSVHLILFPFHHTSPLPFFIFLSQSHIFLLFLCRILFSFPPLFRLFHLPLTLPHSLSCSPSTLYFFLSLFFYLKRNLFFSNSYYFLFLSLMLTRFNFLPQSPSFFFLPISFSILLSPYTSLTFIYLSLYLISFILKLFRNSFSLILMERSPSFLLIGDLS